MPDLDFEVSTDRLVIYLEVDHMDLGEVAILFTFVNVAIQRDLERRRTYGIGTRDDFQHITCYRHELALLSVEV
jgi:hypothetical protein